MGPICIIVIPLLSFTCFLLFFLTFQIAEVETIACIVSLGLPSTGVSHTWEVRYWSHSQTFFGLILRPSLVSFSGLLWSHSQTFFGLISRPSLVSFPGLLWSHSQAFFGLIPRPSLVSFPDCPNSSYFAR